MSGDNKNEKVTNKLSASVEKILNKIGDKEQRLSESCVYLDSKSAYCLDLSEYPVKKGSNITEIDTKVKESLDKFGREDLELSIGCTQKVKNLLCLLEYQKCSTEGELLPVCGAVQIDALKSCVTEKHDFDEISKLVKSVIDVKRISNSTDCFSGPSQTSTTTPLSTESESTPNKAAEEEKKDNQGTLENKPSEPEPEPRDCSHYDYEISHNEPQCFNVKAENFTKLPSLNDVQTKEIGFTLREGTQCKDYLRLKDVQIDQPCACDTKLSYVRFPCEHALSAFGLRSESLVVSFRDVQYVPGLEKQLHFAHTHKSGTHEHTSQRRQFDDDSLDDENDPHYFKRFYYKTCDRLIGVKTSTTVKHCSRHAKLDINEDPNTKVEVYNNFKSSKIKNRFRSGCTVLDCLHHLRYQPPKSTTPNSSTPDVFNDDGTVDTNYDICKENITDCPTWSFNDKVISISGYPANITSFLELDILAHSNTNRSAIIFSFRSMSNPLYEGLRFLLNGVPAMDLVYNQTDYAGYAVPLVPGKPHVARWEFIRGEASSSTWFNSADIESIILRDATLATPEDTADLKSMHHLQNIKVHIPEHAPLRPGAAYPGTPSSSTLPFIPMLIILLTGGIIALLGVWLWRRYQAQKDQEGDHSLGSYSAPLGFAERVAQFSFPGGNNSANSRYAPIGKNGSIDTPHVELNTMKMFENHLPGPNDSDSSDDEPSAFDRAISPSTESTSSNTLQVTPEIQKRENLI